MVANPLPEAEQLDPALHERVLADGLAAAARAGATGKDATPFLLDFFHRETGGASLEVNVRIVLRNAELAARIAAAARRDAIVVVGDLMVDVVAALPGPLAHGSDTPARDRAPRSGGSGANVAAWLAAAGRASRRSRAARAPTRSATPRWRRWPASTLAVERDPERADRHLHRARAPRRRADDDPRRGRQRRARARRAAGGRRTCT